MEKCKACQYTSEIHKESVEKELKRLSEMKGIKICSESEHIERLNICSKCKYLDLNGVCLMCGCYVQIRTFLKDNKCPAKNKLW